MLKRILGSTVLLLSIAATPAFAQTTGSASGAITFVGTLSSDSRVVFGVSAVPPGTCTMYNNYEFIFDAGTAGGKNMYAFLLEMVAMGKTVSFDYSYSTAIGTNQNNGCTFNTLAVVNSIYRGLP